jgi:alpha-beta hydrolase superfamily lysophospholipase
LESAEFQHRFAGGQHAWVRCWRADGAAKGVLQVIHGMAEHSARYDRMARALNSAGYAVFSHDLPGHGPHADARTRGHFADRRGWRVAINSIREVQRLAQRELPGKPLFMLGHSMGSYLLQHFVADSGNALAGAVFSATSGDLGALRSVGLNLIRLEAAIYGIRHPSAVGERLSFRTFNRRFKPARTPFDWLSRDPSEVDKYVADPHCGYRVSTGVWIELLQVGGQLVAPNRLRRIPKALPVFIIAGEHDPACGGERGPRALERKYQQVGLRDVTVRIYPEARHELFNDTCREEVTGDLVAWLDRHLEPPEDQTRTYR